MMKNVKSALKLMKYSYGIKQTLVCATIFTAAGIALQCVGTQFGFIGSFFLLIVAMWPTQLVYTLNMSNMVESASLKKPFQTSVPTFINFAGITIMYVIVLIIKAAMIYMHPEMHATIINEIVFSGITMVGIMIYTAVAYKFFIASMVIFLVIYMVIYNLVMTGILVDLNVFSVNTMNFGTAAVIGIVLIIAGGLLEYVVSLAVYKAPMSKKAQMASLRKSL